jgi:hypothetical protein
VVQSHAHPAPPVAPVQGQQQFQRLKVVFSSFSWVSLFLAGSVTTFNLRKIRVLRSFTFCFEIYVYYPFWHLCLIQRRIHLRNVCGMYNAWYSNIVHTRFLLSPHMIDLQSCIVK